MYEYKMKVVRVVDGDTVIGLIDLGLHIYVTRSVRMLGYNAPELMVVHAKCRAETVAGRVAMEKLEELIGDGELRIKTQLDHSDKYGRVLGELYAADGGSINQNMAGICAGLWGELKHDNPDVYVDSSAGA